MRSAAVVALLCLPLFAYAVQTVEIASSVVGVCTLTVEADAEWKLLQLRALHPEYKDCAIDKEAMLALVRAALAKSDPPPPAGGYKTIYIGGLVDHP
jgi:hypothetical protein